VAVLPEDLARALQSELSIERAVETGTHIGGGAEKLAGIFPRVISIEVSRELHEEAKRRLGGRSSIELLLGDSLDVLPEVRDPDVPTFFWLDGHWTPTDTTPSADGGGTGVGSVECPVLSEIGLLTEGHADDCFVVDDARIFAVAPTAPCDPDQWPSIVEVIDALRAARPEHHVTLAADYVIAVPHRARRILDEVARTWMTHQGWATTEEPMELTEEGWVVDRAYEARIEQRVQERLASELTRRSLRGRVGRALGRG
jgi:hypothetical protein